MLEIGSSPTKSVSGYGCFLWILCALILGGLLIFGMKKGIEWSEGMFGEIKTDSNTGNHK